MKDVIESGRHAWELTASKQDIALWREKAGAAVAALGGGSEAVETARLGVSELLANVVAHVADPRCRLEVTRDESGIRVRLFDRSRRPPAVLRPNWESEHGRGLWLVRELSEALGYVLTGSGKWVWFRVGAPAPGRETGVPVPAGGTVRLDHQVRVEEGRPA
ncbi:ATP-binding protein [Streptomyces sp. ST2-7A]|uniref:ATP-binding protein n=1 Tax=Streptomyces sp. ST2-7A TaxID=2907214 RepID=UPI001F47E3F9|nr:ATP-binding protein [Streptomyces sp. ST2-7A]MCE7082828.1 ATP-binding protein [Streptomyces sp. ST2-7A]